MTKTIITKNRAAMALAYKKASLRQGGSNNCGRKNRRAFSRRGSKGKVRRSARNGFRCRCCGRKVMKCKKASTGPKKGRGQMRI